MRTIVQVKAAGFEGSFPCTVEINEWKAFVQVLRDLETPTGKEAKAAWGNMEENVEFQFTLGANGTLRGEYRFSPENFSLGPILSGAFEADRTSLRAWAQSAYQVLEHAR